MKTTTGDPKQTDKSPNMHTIIQSTSLFKDMSQIQEPAKRIRTRSSSRDLRPFEWLYKHLSDYLMCSYGERTDCDKKLAKSMALEESITKLENLKNRLQEKPLGDEMQPPVDTIHSNVPIMSDFGFDATEPDHRKPIEYRPKGDFKMFYPRHIENLFNRDTRPPFSSKVREPFTSFTRPMDKPWPEWVKGERDFRYPPKMSEGPMGPKNEDWWDGDHRFKYISEPMRQDLPHIPFMSMPLFLP